MYTPNRRARRTVLPLLTLTAVLGLPAILPAASFAAPVGRIRQSGMEGVTRSQLLGTTLPKNAVRLTSGEGFEQVAANLGKVAESDGRMLGKTELIVWGGKENDREQQDAIMQEVIRSIKKAGLRYEVQKDKTDDENTRVIRFLATSADGKRNVLGVWVSGQYLMLALGSVSAKAEGPGDLSIPSFTDPDETPARPAPGKPAASKLPPAEQKVVDSALEEAIENKDTEQVRTLLAKGANPRLRTNGGEGQSVLMRAVISGRAESVKALLAAGADPNAPEKMGMSPLKIAALIGQMEMMEMLLAKGAQVNATGGDGTTALHTAIIGKRTEVVRLLIKKGADVNKADRYGKTPLQMAERDGLTEIVEALREAGGK
jgi:hypothetical protein